MSFSTALGLKMWPENSGRPVGPSQGGKADPVSVIKETVLASLSAGSPDGMASLLRGVTGMWQYCVSSVSVPRMPSADG